MASCCVFCLLKGGYYKHAFVVARENPEAAASFRFNAIKTCSKLSEGGHCTPLLCVLICFSSGSMVKCKL